MKSDVADLNNMAAEKNAGTISGAVFLKNFVEKTPWAHIDIAGTAWYSKARGYRPKNATGYGLRLVVDLIKDWN
jgi:leucyl aminopeptidase